MNIAAFSEQLGNMILLLFLVGIPLYAYIRKVPVFETFVEGAKEGIPTFIRIVPFIVGMLVAIGMLRASGAFDLFIDFFSPLLVKIGIPPEIVPIALVRPFSGSASTAAVADLLHSAGGNNALSHIGAIVAGTTETTFYIITLYFGAAAIRNTRYAIPASILVDIIGILTAVWIGKWLLT